MPKSEYSTVSVRLTAEEKKEIKEYADKHDLSISQVIRKAVKELIKNN